MTDKPKKERKAAQFTVLVASGKNDKGEDTFTVKGEIEGTSKKNAITKAAVGGELDVKIGDEVACVSSKQFVLKPIGLSI